MNAKDDLLANQQYLAMVEDMLDMVCRMDPDHNHTFVNRAYADFIGMPPEKLIGLNELDAGLIHGDDQEEVIRTVQSLSPQSPVAKRTVRYRNAHKEFAHIEWTVRGFFDEQGELLEFHTVGRDISEHIETQAFLKSVKATLEQRVQKRTEELNIMVQKLDASNQYLTGVLMNISEGVVVADRHGNIDYLNAILEQEWGESFQRFKEIFRQHILEKKIHLIEKMFYDKSPFFDIEILMSDEDKHFHCHMSGIPLDHNNFDDNNYRGVLIIRPIKKVHTLVNRLSGAYASSTFDDFITGDEELLKIKQEAQRAALSDHSILIQGESGTGKEIFAQAIHNASARRQGPFLAINCGAIPRDLISSELFGYVEGAFTGAKKGGQPGKFELASGGTLFLDEIGDLPLEQQIVLLRVLQEKQVMRIGAEQPIPVDARIICATNKDLQEETDNGNFRLDLFYRLNVINFHLPPLRERQEDIAILFSHFLKKTGENRDLQFATGILDKLKAYKWPGNVRELQNLVERMVYLATDNTITFRHLPKHLQGDISEAMIREKQTAVRLTLEEARTLRKMETERRESNEILMLLEHYQDNMSEVARHMGISRSTLYRKMKLYSIEMK